MNINALNRSWLAERPDNSGLSVLRSPAQTDTDPQVQISSAGSAAAKTGAAPAKYMMLDVFGTEAHRSPPQPASALEEMIYARGGQKIDFTQVPPRWPDNNQVLNYNSWLDYEKELDKQTEARIDIYEKAMLAGRSKQEIIEQIEQYNSSLGRRYYHSTAVEDRPNDIEREKYQLPPAGTARHEVTARRDEAYHQMVNAMTTARKALQSYTG